MGNRTAETGAPLADSVSETLQPLLRDVRTLHSLPAENGRRERALSRLLPKLGQAVPLETELSREAVCWPEGGIRAFGRVPEPHQTEGGADYDIEPMGHTL